MLKFIKIGLCALIAGSFLGYGCCCHGCKTQCQKTCKKSQVKDIYNSWSVAKLPAAVEKNVKIVPDAFITIENKKIFGNAGDNRFFGSFSIEGDRVDFGTIGVTRMAGPNMKFEDLFLDALNRTKYLEMKEGNLCFLNDKRELLVAFKVKK